MLKIDKNLGLIIAPRTPPGRLRSGRRVRDNRNLDPLPRETKRLQGRGGRIGAAPQCAAQIVDPGRRASLTHSRRRVIGEEAL